MKIIAMRMGELPVVDELESGLEAFQAFVEGYIEAVTLDSSIDGSIMLWCNEEGKFTKAPNRLVEVGAFQDVIHGPCFISAVDNEGETVGLSVEEAKYWMRVASDWMRAISSLPEDYVSVPGEQLLVL